MYSISVKSLLFIRTVLTLVNCMYFIVDAKHNLMPVFLEDSNKMKRWEPSEILASPVPLLSLTTLTLHASASISILSLLLFVIETFCVEKKSYIPTSEELQNISSPDDVHQSSSMYSSNDENTGLSLKEFTLYVANYFISSALLQFIIMLVILLSGASSAQHINHSIMASAYLSNLMFAYIPPSSDHIFSLRSISTVIMAFSKYNSSSNIRFHQDQHAILHDIVNNFNGCILYSILGTMCPFMILNVLDHGEQYQRWPIPIILAALIGHVIGCVVGIIAAWVKFHRHVTTLHKEHTV